MVTRHTHQLKRATSSQAVLMLLLYLLSSCQPGSTDTVDDHKSNMVFIPGATFHMGLEHPMMPEARPVHKVTVNSFYIAPYEVTNAEFARFIDATHYKTVAERPLNPTEFPDADPTLLVPGSIVFNAPGHPVSKRDPSQWWQYVAGANWRNPEGPESSIEHRMDHPVIHIAWEDAIAYTNWVGMRLPTEAEWELAARGGMAETEYIWGENPATKNKPLANIFQGDFPHNNQSSDGYKTTAPVGSFQANGFGLHDMSGNAWEWVQDWYDPKAYTRRAASKPIKNPTGPHQPPNGIHYKVQKGGSFLCTDQYCGRFRPGARGRGDWLTSSNHVGFRLAKDASPN